MIGIDISDKSIKVAEVTGGDYPLLRTVCWSPLAPRLMRRGIVQDIPAVTKALGQAMTRCSPLPVKEKYAVASIPEMQSFLRVIDLPTMKEREADEAVRWAIRRHIPFDLDKVYLDWEPVDSSREGRYHQVLVGVAQREVVDPLLAVLDGLGLNVMALELEARSVVRCLLPRSREEAADIRGVLVIDLGATSTNVVFFDRGAMRYTASIQTGGDDLTRRLAARLGLSLSEAAEKKSAAGPAGKEGTQLREVLKEGVLELIRQVERVVKEMVVQLPPEERVRAILLAGGGSNLSGMTGEFGKIFSGVPVQLGSPWTNVGGKVTTGGANISTADAMHFTTAIGLALRDENLGD